MNSTYNPTRPYILSIAGFDPSAGAGLLADIKTVEQCGVYGMGVVSALTYQNDSSFEKIEWLSLSQIISQIEVLQKRFQFEYIKIGLVQNLEILFELVSYLKTSPNSKLPTPNLIWDPILKASAGFEFHSDVNKNLLEKICTNIYLITPNIPEALQLGTCNSADSDAQYLSQFCNVYLKGGHNDKNKGNDLLFRKGAQQHTLFQSSINTAYPKHGSGCVLSSAITAHLAKGLAIETACYEAKKYITDFLISTESLLGYHSVITTFEHE